MALSDNINKALKKINQFVKPDAPGIYPSSVIQAYRQLENMSGVSCYKYYDDEIDVLFFDNGERPEVGFFLEVAVEAGAEAEFEQKWSELFEKSPVGTILMFGTLTEPLADMPNAGAEYAHYYKKSVSGSILKNKNFQPRARSSYICFKAPYLGQMTDTDETENFLKGLLVLRENFIADVSKNAYIHCKKATFEQLTTLFRKIYSPFDDYSDDDYFEAVPEGFFSIFSQSFKTLDDKGQLVYSDPNGDSELACYSLTIDAYPSQQDYHPWKEVLDSTVISGQTLPFWQYTQYHKIPESSYSDVVKITGKAASTPPGGKLWFEHALPKKDISYVENFEHEPATPLQVKVFSGLVVYGPSERAEQECTNIKKYLMSVGLRANLEVFHGLQSFISAMPLQISLRNSFGRWYYDLFDNCKSLAYVSASRLTFAKNSIFTLGRNKVLETIPVSKFYNKFYLYDHSSDGAELLFTDIASKLPACVSISFGRELVPSVAKAQVIDLNKSADILGMLKYSKTDISAITPILQQFSLYSFYENKPEDDLSEQEIADIGLLTTKELTKGNDAKFLNIIPTAVLEYYAQDKFKNADQLSGSKFEIIVGNRDNFEIAILFGILLAFVHKCPLFIENISYFEDPILTDFAVYFLKFVKDNKIPHCISYSVSSTEEATDLSKYTVAYPSDHWVYFPMYSHAQVKLAEGGVITNEKLMQIVPTLTGTDDYYEFVFNGQIKIIAYPHQLKLKLSNKEEHKLELSLIESKKGVST